MGAGVWCLTRSWQVWLRKRSSTARGLDAVCAPVLFHLDGDKVYTCSGSWDKVNTQTPNFLAAPDIANDTGGHVWKQPAHIEQRGRDPQAISSNTELTLFINELHGRMESLPHTPNLPWEM